MYKWTWYTTQIRGQVVLVRIQATSGPGGSPGRRVRRQVPTNVAKTDAPVKKGLGLFLWTWSSHVSVCACEVGRWWARGFPRHEAWRIGATTGSQPEYYIFFRGKRKQEAVAFSYCLCSELVTMTIRQTTKLKYSHGLEADRKPPVSTHTMYTLKHIWEHVSFPWDDVILLIENNSLPSQFIYFFNLMVTWGQIKILL